jgi:hypothetical protein
LLEVECASTQDAPEISRTHFSYRVATLRPRNLDGCKHNSITRVWDEELDTYNVMRGHFSLERFWTTEDIDVKGTKKSLSWGSHSCQIVTRDSLSLLSGVGDTVRMLCIILKRRERMMGRWASPGRALKHGLSV